MRVEALARRVVVHERVVWRRVGGKDARRDSPALEADAEDVCVAVAVVVAVADAEHIEALPEIAATLAPAVADNAAATVADPAIAGAAYI